MEQEEIQEGRHAGEKPHYEKGGPRISLSQKRNGPQREDDSKRAGKGRGRGNGAGHWSECLEPEAAWIKHDENIHDCDLRRGHNPFGRFDAVSGKRQWSGRDLRAPQQIDERDETEGQGRPEPSLSGAVRPDELVCRENKWKRDCVFFGQKRQREGQPGADLKGESFA
jgi:hypothetical protein